MRVLLDEMLPHFLRDALPGFEVVSARWLGWTGITNGALLRRAEAEGFDVVLTMDRNLRYQQNLARFNLAVIVLIAPSARVSALRPLIEGIRRALEVVRPGEVVEVRAEESSPAL